MATNNTGVILKIGLGVVALCIAGYIVGPPLYWHLMEGLLDVNHSSSPSSSSSCAPCLCDCSSQPILSIPQETSIRLENYIKAKEQKRSFDLHLHWKCNTDCAKPDPEVSGDTEKNFGELLSEELKLRENKALEQQQRADMALLEAKKIASSYQKEADKCNSGMETCEEAREKAELTLVAQKKLSALWELRARQKGWKEGAANSQGNVQTKLLTE